MSSWIRDGLQNLTGYFGAEEDEDVVAAVDAVGSSAGINDRDAVSSNKNTITSHDQGVHKNNKRKAVGISSASLEDVSSDTRLLSSDETDGNSYAAATKRQTTFLTSKSLPDDDDDNYEDYSGKAEAGTL